MRIDREQFLLAIRRAALLSTPDYQAVKLEVFKNKLVVSKSTPDVGESREEVAVEYQGKELVIGFNPNYLIDVLKNLIPRECGIGNDRIAKNPALSETTVTFISCFRCA